MTEKKAHSITVSMALGIMIIILVVSLFATIVNYSCIVNDRDELIDKLNVEKEIDQNEIARLNSLIDSLTKSFFIQDPDFTTTLDKNVFWGVEAWHKNDDSVCEINNGILHLFYNGTIGYSYGNSGVFQGTHTYGGFTHQLLVGDSPEDSYYSDCVILPKGMPSGKLWLETNFTITRMGFDLYPTVYDFYPTTYGPLVARVNLGVTLMCAINDQPLNLTGQNLWLDVYFAGYSLNGTSIEYIPKDNGYANQTGDIHAGYFVGEVSPKHFGESVSMRVDLGDYISKTLWLINRIDIKTIRIYGLILFVECLGAYAEVEYDYVRTTGA